MAKVFSDLCCYSQTYPLVKVLQLRVAVADCPVGNLAFDVDVVDLRKAGETYNERVSACLLGFRTSHKELDNAFLGALLLTKLHLVLQVAHKTVEGSAPIVQQTFLSVEVQII